MLEILIFIADFTAKLPLSKILIPTPNIIFIIIYYVIILFCNKINIKKTIIILLIIIIIFNVLNLLPKDLRIYFIDVGQGDSTLILTPKGNSILIDGGGSETGSFDVGEKILLPYLLDRGVTKIDYMMISHFDSDHVGGLFSILENLRVEHVLISKQGKESENYKHFLEISKGKRLKLFMQKREIE